MIQTDKWAVTKAVKKKKKKSEEHKILENGKPVKCDVAWVEKKNGKMDKE